MSRLLLSIAIPTYNRAALLDLCLNRFFDQLGPYAEQVEVLVSDNASTDHTKAVVEKHQSQHRQLSYFENEKNEGPDFNIARCFELATAKYVWVFSDDDVILPGALDYIIPFLRQHEVGVLLTKPHFYHDSVHEFVPDEGPLGYKLYLVLGMDTLYRYQDSFMIQLGWVMPALVRAKQNAEITTPLVLARALRVLDFRMFYVFGVSYPRVLASLAASGVIPEAMKDLLIDLLIRIYFGYYARNGNKGTASHHKERPLLILGKAFWKRKGFWLVLVPGFLQRGVIDALKALWLGTRKAIVKASVKTDKVRARLSADLKADLAAESWKHFGEKSQLPTVHTVLNPQCVEVGLGLQALSPFVIEARTWQAGQYFAPKVVIGDRVK
ncbi:MAG: glycosyltransferase family 2 protein, partial [Hymenobacter sp.]